VEKKIRQVEASDARAVRDIYAPFVSDTATSFELDVPEPAEIERRIQTQRDRYPWLVFERAGAILGYAYASAHRTRKAYQWCVEVSVYVDPQTHRCGIGRALYSALFELLRRQGYLNAYAGITLPNQASLELHRALGFTHIGVFSRIGFKFDQWHDVAWLHLRLGEGSMPPFDPTPAAHLWEEQQVRTMLDACAQSVRT